MTGDPIPQMISFFEERMQVAESYGIDKGDIILDPGIGFGKSMEQNASILDRLGSLKIGNPLLVAVSRKRVLSHIYPDMDRDESTILANLDSISKGADIVRVHDTRRMVEAIRGCTRRL
jgi:dihydropteroate synthase